MTKRNKLGQFVKGAHLAIQFQKGNTIGFKTRFQKGHSLIGGMHSGHFKKGNKFGIANRFKKGSQSGPKKGQKRPEITGDKNPNWQGGITPENLKLRKSIEYRLWREAVYARDNWTCQKCDEMKSGSFNAHHIQNFHQYPELRFAINNGITFCEKCHNEFHRRFGFRNNNQKQVKQFLNE